MNAPPTAQAPPEGGGAPPWQDPRVISELLEHPTWAIVGLGENPERVAYRIAALLIERGKRIVPIHPSAAVVHGQQGYRSLADVPFAVDVVDVFRRSEDAGRFVDEAIAIGAKGAWLQLGVLDTDAFARAQQAGLPVVMDTCPAIEWRRRV